MIENQFKLKKLVGIMLILVGIGGISYLLWVYVIWSHTLSAFPKETIGEVFGVKSVRAHEGGFGDLLGERSERNDQSEPTYTIPISPLPRVESDSRDSNKPSEGVVLSIPRLGITGVRVMLDVNGQDESIYDTVLRNNVAHLANSAYPGEVGNMFLFGHSMLPLLANNNYESIFTNLPQMRSGDVVSVTKDNATYVYEVTHTGVVEPTDVFIMNQPKNKRMITIMTCIPPGFANQRYIAVGTLIRIENH